MIRTLQQKVTNMSTDAFDRSRTYLVVRILTTAYAGRIRANC